MIKPRGEYFAESGCRGVGKVMTLDEFARMIGIKFNEGEDARVVMNEENNRPIIDLTPRVNCCFNCNYCEDYVGQEEYVFYRCKLLDEEHGISAPDITPTHYCNRHKRS